MKNMGMTGAVALVGIGLITIGMSQNSPLATAASPSSVPPNHPRGDSEGCPTALFEPTITVVQTECGLNGFTGEKNLVMADVLSLGYAQAVQMPSQYSGGLLPLQVRGRDFILTMDVALLELAFGDWAPGTYDNLQGAGLIDMDEDGRIDLLVTARQGVENRFGYLRNIYDAPARLPADLDNDGDVDGADLGELFSQWTG